MSASFFSYLPKSRKTKNISERGSGSRMREENQQIALETLQTCKSFISTVASTVPRTTAKKLPRIEESQSKITIQENTKNTYNILSIDSDIKTKLSSKITTLPNLKKELSNMIWLIDHCDNASDKLTAQHQITLLRRRIQDLEGTFELGMYMLRTSRLIDEYKRLSTSRGPRSFITSTTVDPNAARKNEIIMAYLRIAREYIDIENITQRVKKLSCPRCGGLDFSLEAEEDTIYTCNGCGTLLELLDDSPSFKDTDRVNMSSRYTYTKRGHFIDAMKRFQGKQNTTIEDWVINKIREEMAIHNLTPNNLTKDQLYMFLAENKLANYYEDLNLLYFIIAQVKPPDISSYETALLEKFDKLEEAYSEVKDPTRINSLSVNYKLYKLLQILGYPCKKDDFYILKTTAKSDEHDEKWQEICTVLGWKPLPTV